MMSERPLRRRRSASIWPPEPLLGEEVLEATLDLVISLVTCTVQGAAGMSVSLRTRAPGEFHTPSATSTALRELDAAQYETNRGPCIEAARTGEPVNAVIASERRRWPEFTKEAAKRGMKSVLSVPLVNGEGVIGALNVYSERSQVFGEHDQRVVAQFARHAGVVLKHASEFMMSDWISEQVDEALSTADVIGQAKGILIANGYTADEALATLRRSSRRSNRKLRDVAQDMVTSSRRVRPS